MTSIEEIVKYQQELLNFQRSQKQIQRETIKLLNSLNSSLSLMSDRLDEFAIKTNMKLEDFNLTPTNSNTVLINNSGGMVNNSASKNDVLILNDLNSLNPSLINLDQLTTGNSTSHNKIFLINNSGGVINNSAPVPVGHNNKNDVFILNDLNSLNPSLNIDQLSNINSNSHSANKIFLINNNATITTTGNELIRPLIKLDNTSICNGNLNTTTTVNNKMNSTINNTSDDSMSGDVSYDESSNEEKETIQSKKKPRRNRSRDGSSLRCSVKDTEEGTNQQRLFNKFVREKVEARLGKDFLLLHEIQEINSDIMEEIKKEALEAYPPINIRPRRAWHLAKASLRCRRRSLRRQKERSIIQNIQNGTPQSTVAASGSNPGVNSSNSSSGSAANKQVHHHQENKILIEPSLIQPHLTISSA